MYRLGLILISGVLVAAEPRILREGPYWVVTESSSELLNHARRLHVTAIGHVTLAGAQQDRVTCSMIQRVRARNEAEARQLLQTARLRFVHLGGNAMLIVQQGPGMAELNVKIPRGLEEVVIGTSQGNVEVEDLDGDLRVITGGGRVNADRIRGDIEARTAGGVIRLGAIGGSAHCMSGGGVIQAGSIRGEALFETGGGMIELKEAGGPVRASTGAGGIRIERAHQSVTVVTAGGPIEIGDANGIVVAKNQGGPIQVGTAYGVQCESAGGGIRLGSVTGSVRASTAVGSIMARLMAGLAESFLTTGNGDITVLIPSNVGVTVRARNEASSSVRRIVSEFPGLIVRSEGGIAVAEGAINGGGPLLRISGTGGMIFIKRQN